MYFVLSNIFSCIGVGLLVAAIVVALIYVTGVVLGGRHTVGSILVLVVAFLLSGFRGTVLAGWYMAKEYVDGFVGMCTAILHNQGIEPDDILADELVRRVSDEYPAVSVMFDWWSFTKGCSVRFIFDSVSEKVGHEILVQWIWLVGIVVVCGLLSLCLMKSAEKSRSSRRERPLEHRPRRSAMTRRRIR